MSKPAAVLDPTRDNVFYHNSTMHHHLAV